MTNARSADFEGCAERQLADQTAMKPIFKLASRFSIFNPSVVRDPDSMKVSVIEHLTGQKLAPRRERAGSNLAVLLLILIALPVFLLL